MLFRSELAWLVRAGLTPAQALHAATGSAADLLDRDDIGRVAAGRVADLVVLDGDLADLEHFADNLRLVLRDGEVVRRREGAA